MVADAPRAETGGVARPQVLLSGMPVLVEDLLRSVLAGAEVDLLPAGSTTQALRQVEEDDPPPVVIVIADGPAASQRERDLLLPHPQAVILRVEGDGRLLASRSIEVRRHLLPGAFSPESLIRAIETAPRWRERFAS